MRGAAPAGRVADAVVFAAFLGVPLLVSPALWDQYVSVKWYALEALAACWLVAEAWAGGAGLPRFVRAHGALVLLAAALALASVFREGAAAALSPLVERTAVAALALSAFWFVRRRAGDLTPVRAATAVALAVATAIGLAQLAGRDPLADLTAGDGRGSTFGNANMAAQYAGLSLLLLLAPPRPRRGWVTVAEVALAGAAALWLVALATRSVLLAAGAGALAAALASGGKARLRGAAVAAACVGATALSLWVAARLLGPEARAHKTASVAHRLHVWSDTLRLVRDHPLGVGAGRFEDAYRPYQAAGSGSPDETQVYRQPHNEYLRLAAEEGLPFVIVAAVLLARLGAAVARRWRASVPPGRGLAAGWAAFLAVEAVFQFPLALAFPALAAALLCGLLLWHADGAPAAEPSAGAGAWRVASAAAAAVLLAGAGRLALSELLFVAARDDLAAQERACRLDARNLPACVMAAWLRGNAGDLPGSRARLAEVLQRAPHYPPAVKLLAQQAALAGDREAACVYMAAYEALFRGRSSLHAEYLRACDEAARARARLRVPSPFYGRFPFAGEDAR